MDLNPMKTVNENVNLTRSNKSHAEISFGHTTSNR